MISNSALHERTSFSERQLFVSFQVVANAVAALSEIAEASPHLQVMDMNSSTINKLLTALNECTEWGQVFILDCLSSYTPKDDREAQSTCERVTPRLAHANAAVVLSAVKVAGRFSFHWVMGLFS